MINIKDTLTYVVLYNNPLKCMGEKSSNDSSVLFKEIEKFYKCGESSDLVMITKSRGNYLLKDPDILDNVKEKVKSMTYII